MSGATVALQMTDSTVSIRRLSLATCVVLLNVADVISTKAVLARGGIEGNPVMADLMTGFAAPLGLKMIAGVVGLLLMMCPPESRFAERAVTTVVGIYTAVVVWNMAILGLLFMR
jgi:hypothetical protein